MPWRVTVASMHTSTLRMRFMTLISGCPTMPPAHWSQSRNPRTKNVALPALP
ncbi:Uncharacterised protein [Mycobacterium tuberculosis]|uniref:Uncharacterized protein n=1 Tax=Mycobacterium tuberculosis TaxID=1773 RepID=A0A0U0S815_MYCTX|nr:Uncharacterised protein [Mycobacterium tuberculosis]COW10556.1 Uncharacterised protein [Mycobacterium tuberculosis]COW52419.1 Uncharacterised protein [Mycobacterium tuberculosis]